MLKLGASRAATGATSEEVRPLLLGDSWYDDRPGGLNRYFAELLRALPEGGVEARGVVVGAASGAPASVTGVSGREEPIGRRVWKVYQAAAAEGREATVVDVHFVLYAFVPVVIGRLRKLPLVVHFHGPWAAESRVQRQNASIGILAKGVVERIMYRRAAHVVVLSYAFKRLLVESHGVVPWRVEVVPPGVDLDRLRPGDPGTARRSYGLPEPCRVVIAVRRLVPRMGLDVLLRAWVDVVEEIEDAVLLVVGEGPQREALEAEVERLAVSSSVRFLGRVGDDELRTLYQLADLAVVPSVALEGFGLVVLEALACGTPVLTTDVGGLPEVVSGLDPNLVVAAGSPDALAERVASLLAGDTATPSPERCRQYAESFTWDKAVDRHREIYRRPHGNSNGRLRVVYLDHCAQLSGGELAMLRLLPALRTVEPHVILAEDGPLVGKLVQAGISVEVLPMLEMARGMRRAGFETWAPFVGALPVFGYVLRLAARLRKLAPDLVTTNSLKAALYGGLAGRMAGVPVVWHLRDRIADDYLPRNAVTLVKIAAASLPTAIIANSKSTSATIGANRRPRAIIPSPLPPELVAPQPTAVAGEKQGPLRIGVVGRLAPWKGQHLFLKAFANAFPTGDQEAVIIGDALFGERSYEEDLRSQAARLGITDRVDFRGFRSNIVGELSRLDFLVHSSVTPEPFGLSVVEAMAFGLPVIAAAAGGPSETIQQEVSGLLYPPGDSSAMARSMLRLAEDPGLRDRLGTAARASVARYSPEQIADQVDAFFRQILGGP